jgi:tetratricopeptide (TPR) repeat protein
VVKLTPNDPSALQFLGYAQMAAGDIDGALTTFTALTETKAISPAVLSDAYVEMGTCDWAQQRDDQAAEAFSRSLTSNPHQGQASLGIGIYDAAKGKREEARAAFQNAARDLQPGPRRAQAFSCLGRLAEDGNDTAAALAAYKQALALNPDNAWAKRAVSRLQAKPKRS